METITPHNRTGSTQPGIIGGEREQGTLSKEEHENTDDVLRVDDSETANPHAERRTTQEVRQGHTGDHMRYVLGASFAGCVIAFAVVYLLFMR